jgi:UDP-glucose:(galactosyl)LPS alpha-1,2-glucosyltransferase
MQNIVYAVDENYNIQLFISILSLIEKVSEKINLFIIHKNPKTFESFKDILEENDRVNEFVILKFQHTNELRYFPSLDSSHVSEVTYYRFFLDKYLPLNLENIIYLDADIVCINDPIPEILKIQSDLIKYKNPLAARTIGLRMENNDVSKQKIKMKKILMENNRYFSAGVMVINFQKWIKDNIFNDLRIRAVELGDKAELHDQDTLNSYFDSNYLEINEFLNFRIGKDANISNNAFIYKNSVFLHYEGNWKPWTIKGILKESSIFYTNYFRRLRNSYFHITHINRRNSLKDLLNGIINGSIFRLDRPIKFLLEAAKSFF